MSAHGSTAAAATNNNNLTMLFADVELPCDWSVNRRPLVMSAAPQQPQPPPSLPATTTNTAARKKKKKKKKPAVPPAAAAMREDTGKKKRKLGDADAAADESGESDNNDDETVVTRRRPPPTTTTAPMMKAMDQQLFGGGGDDAGAEKGDPLIAAHPLGPFTFSQQEQREAIVATEVAHSEASRERIRRLVLHHLVQNDHHHQGAAAPTTVVDTESLLSRLPYRKMLSDMFGGGLRGNLRNLTIPYITRAYEEAFMREPLSSNERACANGKQCECMFIDRAQPFVAVEFLLPGEPSPRTPHLCVLCSRAITQQLYYDVMFDKADFPGTIQRFGNIHSQPGEYALDAMLIAMPTAPVHIMPLPIVSHQRNRYTVFLSGGVKWLRQSRVYFQSTPSCSADGGI